MKRIFFNGESFDEFAALLEDGAEIILERKEYRVSRTLHIRNAVTIIGNGATLVGDGLAIGIIISASNVTLRDLIAKGMKSIAEVDAEGGVVEHVCIEKLQFSLSPDMALGIQVGSSVSGSVVRDVHVRGCVVTGMDEEWEENELAGVTPFHVMAAVGRKTGSKQIHDCLAEDIFIENNQVTGGMRIAVNIVPGMSSEYDVTGFDYDIENATIRNVHVCGNDIESCWDSPINIIGTFATTKSCGIEGIEIADNHMGFGIAGVYLYADEAVFSDSVGGWIRSVKITGNRLYRSVADVGEPTRGLFLAAARTDYYPNISITDSLLEDVEISGNTIDGAGIVITGCYSLLDGKEITRNNVVRNVQIYDNHILNADYAFTFDGAQIEGRIYDWNFGYPRHDKRWVEDLEDDTVVTNEMTDNRIENLRCVNNRIDGYRYRVTASGANVRGHGLVSGNRVTKDIVFENNVYGIGENHVKVAGLISEDYIRDGGGNEVSEVFLSRQKSALTHSKVE